MSAFGFAALNDFDAQIIQIQMQQWTSVPMLSMDFSNHCCRLKSSCLDTGLGTDHKFLKSRLNDDRTFSLKGFTPCL